MKQTKAQHITDIIESWFGQSIDDMDDGDRIRRFLLNPLIEVVESEPQKMDCGCKD